MVVCQENYSFHLSPQGSTDSSDSDCTTYSHKKRIDSLFTDTNEKKKKIYVTRAHIHHDEDVYSAAGSPVSCTVNVPMKTSIKVSPPKAWESKTPTPKEELELLFGGPDRRQQAFLDVRSAVQAQIERVFADASNEPSVTVNKTIPSKENSIPKTHSIPPPPPLPLPPIPSSSPVSSSSPTPSAMSSGSESPIPRPVLATMKYRVDYLGTLQLGGKASSLEILQEPLKELYYKYRLSISRNRRQLPGGFHITENGVRITHGTRELPGYYELLNPFSSIAVWAAVKLVIRREVGEHGQMFFSYAFLPLICDPETNDKYNLYHELNVGNPNLMAGEHPPMFACVMRKKGVPHILECHGFVCQSSEDAIVMAANLYQALLETMKHGDPFSDTSSDTRDDERFIMSDSETVPVRPPRKRKSRATETLPRNLKRSNSEDLLRSDYVTTGPSMNRIKRSVSDRLSISGLEEEEQYVKVPLARSKSFINVTNKYDFKELLLDVRKSTGLKSVDDVLMQVINPRGMSFSEMDPKYRDLLLKLALTLSKDEIYQRSKSIMRKQRLRSQQMESDSESSTISSVIKATKRSFSRLGSRASSLQSSYSKDGSSQRKSVTDQYFLREEEREKEILRTLERKQAKASTLDRHHRYMPKTPMPKRNSSVMSDGYGSCSECGYDSECSSKCYCSLPRTGIEQRMNHLRTAHFQPHNKQSIKKRSDLLCECDTESCAESEKCYCSLKGVKNNGIRMYEINLDSDTNTDGTHRSNITRGEHPASASLDSQKFKHFSSYSTGQSKSRSAGTIFSLDPEIIRQKSLSSNLSSDSEQSDINKSSRSSVASGYHSQDSVKTLNSRRRSASIGIMSDNGRLCRHTSGSTGSTCSDDSIKSTQRSYQGTIRQTKSNDSQAKILLVSAVDPSGKVVYRGASQKQKNEGSDTNSILSMKKTAEIAALFSGLKLNQTTDLINQLQNYSDSDDDAYASLQRNNSILFSDNIETSLGYLP